MRARRPRTVSLRRSVPMCGLAVQSDSLRRAGGDKSSSTLRARGSLVPVLSLPSEKVPAPPSPNWTLESGRKRPPPPEAFNVAGALLHGAAAFDQQRPLPCLGEKKSGKEPGGTASHDDRPLGQTAVRRQLVAVGKGGTHLLPGAAGEQPVLRNGDDGVRRTDKADAVLFARVDRTAVKRKAENILQRQAQPFGRRFLKSASL